MPKPGGSQPDYFQIACDIARKRAEELKRACFNCHEDNSGTVMLCPLHAAASMLLALVRAHALSYPHDEYEDRIAAVLKEIEG